MLQRFMALAYKNWETAETSAFFNDKAESKELFSFLEVINRNCLLLHKPVVFS